jgi:hypothetical protein
LRTLRPSLTLLALAAVALNAACAGDPEGRPRRDPHKDATLFISPAGKPFHADPGQPYPVRAWFAEADRNHDGRITREEFRADFEAFFNRLDTNHDGFIDGLETAAYEETVAPEILPRLAQGRAAGDARGPDETGEPGGGRRSREPRQLAAPPERRGQASIEGAPAFSLMNVSEPVISADANFDGKVSLQEFLAAADRRFDALDTDKLGYLTLEGLPRTPEQILLEGNKPKR